MASGTIIQPVAKSGDTMSGNLKVERAGDAYVDVKNTNTGVSMQIDCSAGGSAGLYSNGYYGSDSSFHSDGRFIIKRGVGGAVDVDGNFFIQFSMSSGSSRTLTFPAKSNHAFIFTSGVGTRTHGIYAVDTASDGYINESAAVVAATDVSVTRSQNVLTVTNNSSAYIFCLYIGFSGNAPTLG